MTVSPRAADTARLSARRSPATSPANARQTPRALRRSRTPATTRDHQRNLDGIVRSWSPGCPAAVRRRAESSVRSVIGSFRPTGSRKRIACGRSAARACGRLTSDTLRLRERISVPISPDRVAIARCRAESSARRKCRSQPRRQRPSRTLRLAAIVDSSDDAHRQQGSEQHHHLVECGCRVRCSATTASEMLGQSIRRLIPDDRQQEEDEVLFRIRRGERVDALRDDSAVRKRRHAHSRVA